MYIVSRPNDLNADLDLLLVWTMESERKSWDLAGAVMEACSSAGSGEAGG